MRNFLSLLPFSLLLATPAYAGELFGGIYVHGVDTPLSLGGDPEDGGDLQIGYRANSIGRLFGRPVQPYAFGALNSAGDTSFFAAGVSSFFGGDRFYFRPGIGLAVHSGSKAEFDNPFNDKVEFGSRLLIQTEVGFGMRVARGITAEASLVHLSHGTLLGPQNPGIDTIGVRLNVQLP